MLKGKKGGNYPKRILPYNTLPNRHDFVTRRAQKTRGGVPSPARPGDSKGPTEWTGQTDPVPARQEKKRGPTLGYNEKGMRVAYGERNVSIRLRAPSKRS